MEDVENSTTSAEAAKIPRLDPEKASQHRKEREEERKKMQQKFKTDAAKAFKQLKKGATKDKSKEKAWIEADVKKKMQTYDDRELIKLEDLANRIPLEKRKLEALKKRINAAKNKLKKDPAERKRVLMEDIEEQRQRKFYLERERVLLTGEKGHISDFKQKLQDNKKKSVELAARKIELEKEKVELDKVAKMLEQVELSAKQEKTEVFYEPEEPVRAQDFDRKFMDLKFRRLAKFRETEETAILELLMRRYCEDLEGLGKLYFAAAKAADLKLEDKDTILNQHIRNKQIKLKALEDKRKEYHKKTADLDKQIATFTKGHEEVTRAVDELGEKLKSMERGHREQVRATAGDTEAFDPKAEALHQFLEEATRKLSNTSEERNKVIIGILLSYNTIKPISYRDADGKKSDPFQAAIAQIPWPTLETQLDDLKQMFVKLTEEFNNYKKQFLDAKREANDFVKTEVKQEVPESAPAKTSKKKKTGAAKPNRKRIKKENDV